MVAVIMGAQESDNVTLGLQDSNKLALTLPNGRATNLWRELENAFQLNAGLSEILMEEDLHVLKFVEKEEPKNLALEISRFFTR
jgi:hypothetical protein